MVDLARDLYRLELLRLGWEGLEGYSAKTAIGDFVHYYFARFITNISHVLHDFSQSEIEQFNQRYPGRIKALLNRPDTALDGVIIPIPKAMVASYPDTFGKLVAILSATNPDALVDDVDALQLNQPATKHRHDDYSKAQFDTARQTIGKLYASTGLNHTFATNGLVSIAALGQLNTLLLAYTKRYYPLVLTLHAKVKTVSDSFASADRRDTDTAVLAKQLMAIGYRLSVFAVVMDHIQTLEHGFVASLKTVLNSAHLA